MPNKEPTKELKEEWGDFHRELYLPGSAINTNTIYEWWEKKIQAREAELIEKIREGFVDGMNGQEVVALIKES